MLADFLNQIPDGSSLYVRPVGFISAALADGSGARPYRGSGRCFTGFVLYVRTPAGAIQTRYVGCAEVDQSAISPHKEAVETLLDGLAAPHAPVALSNGKSLPFTRPLVMGVLNVTPDSFSDGGKFIDTHTAVRHARAMAAAGADIIDIGGESTRPGATPVWEGEEADRVVPVLEALAEEGIALSIDSRNAFVMEKAVEAGAHIINDVSALSHDPDSMALAARLDVPVVLMHAQGDPRTMQDDPHYDHVVLDIYDYLAERIAACEAAGIQKSNIIVDPGIGFGKRVVRDNMDLINGLMLFQALGCPVLLGASRKRFIGAITGVESAEDRVSGSVAAAVLGAQTGANIIRVHDVRETAEAVKLVQASFDASAMDGMPPAG